MRSPKGLPCSQPPANWGCHFPGDQVAIMMPIFGIALLGLKLPLNQPGSGSADSKIVFGTSSRRVRTPTGSTKGRDCSLMLSMRWTRFLLSCRWLDKQWGFALEEGQPWTAPVWMGEFGYLSLGWKPIVWLQTSRIIFKLLPLAMASHAGGFVHVFSVCSKALSLTSLIEEPWQILARVYAPLP